MMFLIMADLRATKRNGFELWKWEGKGNENIRPLHGGLEQQKNRDVSTGPFARPLARLLAPLTHSLAPDCSLRSRPLRSRPLRSRSLTHSLPSSWESVIF